MQMQILDNKSLEMAGLNIRYLHKNSLMPLFNHSF